MPAFTIPARALALSTAALAVVAVLFAPAPAGAARCGKGCADTTRPTITISSPTGGGTVSGTVTVTGTAADNSTLAKVQVAVDGGSWQAVSGTTNWTWSWATGSLANGGHTLSARSTDAAGNVSAPASVAVTVANPVADTTAPTVVISSPAPGTTVTGTVTVSGSASDNIGLATVHLAVDGGAWQPATGSTTWSWSWTTAGLPDGPHTVAARSTDTAGNATTSSVTLSTSNAAPDTAPPAVAITTPAAGDTVSGTVAVSGTASDNAALARVEVAVDGGPWAQASGTTGWSWSWATAAAANGAHTIVARASDASGNVTSTSTTVTLANTSVAPNTQGSWVSPEGVHINVNSAGSWTISQIYAMLQANAIQLDLIGPTYTINVQDTAATQTVTSATTTNGVWGNFKATTYLKGVSSTFASVPDAQMAYEYGGAWSRYHLFMTHDRDWGPYLSTRWSNADGSVTIGEDSRLGSTMSWDPAEMICGDYRLLFGSSQAVAQRPTYMNPDVVDPRNQPGLREWFLSTWA